MKRTLLALLLVGVTTCHREQPAKEAVARATQPKHVSVDAASIPVSAGPSRDAGPEAGPALSDLEQAMARLVHAMLTNDPAGVLACFSKRKPTVLVSSGPDGHTRKMKFPYAAIEKGMKTDGDFWFYFFDDDSELVRGVQRSQRWPLVKKDKFVPPEYANEPDDAPAGIRWRQEGDRYVIDAIFDSGS